MAERKSNNRRSSRYNQSRAGSGRLDPNSVVLGEEDPLWWFNLSPSSRLNLEKYKTIDETSRYLNSQSQIDLSNLSKSWYKGIQDMLERETSKNLPTTEGNKQPVIASPVPKDAETTMSDSDKESGIPSKRIRKIRMRGNVKRSNSNAFLKALDDSKDSKSDNSKHEIVVSNPTNDKSATSEMLKVPGHVENLMGKKDSINVTTSSDESPNADKILKSKPKVFGKRYRKTRKSVIEDALNETEKSKMIRTSSLQELNERNDTSDKNIVVNSEKCASQMQSSMRNSRQFIINVNMSPNDDNYIVRNHSDSSFEIQSNTENSPVQKTSLAKEHQNSSIKPPDSSKRVDNSAHEKTLESSQVEIPKADSRNERFLKNVRHAKVLNESKTSKRNTHSEINRSKSSINVESQSNNNEENLINEINDRNIQETTENEKNLSYKRRRLNFEHMNDDINIKDSFRNNDKINNSKHDVTTDFVNEDLRNVNKTNIPENQISRIIDRDNVVLTENNSENISRNEKKLSDRSISTLSGSSTNYNEKMQSNELDENTSTLTKKSDKSTDIVADENDENLQQRNPLRERILGLMDNFSSRNIDNDQNIEQRDQLHVNQNLKEKDQPPDKIANSINKKELSDRSISTLSESSTNYNEKMQSKELDINTSTLSKKLDKSMDIVANENDENLQRRNPLRERILGLMDNFSSRNIDNDQNIEQRVQLHDNQNLKEKDQPPDKIANSINISQQKNIQAEQNLQKDQLLHKTLNSINTNQKKKIDGNETLQKENKLHNKIVNSANPDKQKKINDYFTATTSKLVSPIETNQSKNIEHPKKMKKGEYVKTRRELKEKLIETNKEICKHLAKINRRTQLSGNEIKEKIKRLQNKETKKKPKKDKMNKAYIVNGKFYKRPKLPRPQAWVTDRFYRRLWKSMEPKFKLLTRVKSENFVKELSDVVTTVIKSKKYADYENRLNDLMNQMAALGIIRTRDDFYIFCHEFLPYDFRMKAIPMITPGNVRNIPFDPEKIDKPLIEE